MESSLHISVLLKESIDALKVHSGGKYIDCTLGAGGHSEEILKRGGEVLGIELDAQMLKIAEERLKNNCPTLVRGNFKDLEKIAKEYEFSEVDGVLMDLGISSLHYELLGRGFSFKKGEEMLDLRLSTEQGVMGATLLNVLSEKQLVGLFDQVLEHFKTRRIVNRILKARAAKPFSKVSDLADIAGELVPEVFLALRVAVNSEFEVLEKGMEGAMRVLAVRGRLVVVSFHSLEDKLVSNSFKKFEKEGLGRKVLGTPIVAGEQELKLNPKSRSALMRVFEKNV